MIIILGCFVVPGQTLPKKYPQLFYQCFKNDIHGYIIVHSAAYCDFEDDDTLCYWNQDKSEAVDWKWFDNNEDGNYKGPLEDHTTGTLAGQFLF